jgi:hypothetical protein
MKKLCALARSPFVIDAGSAGRGLAPASAMFAAMFSATESAFDIGKEGGGYACGVCHWSYLLLAMPPAHPQAIWS